MRINAASVEGDSIDFTWYLLLREIAKKGRRYAITSGSHAGSNRLSFDSIYGVCQDAHRRPLAVTVPEGLSIQSPTTEDYINEYFANYIMDPIIRPDKVCQNELCDYFKRRLSRMGMYCPKCNGPLKEIITEEYKYASWIIGGTDICPTRQLDWIIDHFGKAGLGNEHCTIMVGDHESNLAYDRPFKQCINPMCSIKNGWYGQNYKQCPSCHEELRVDETKRGTSPCLRMLDFRVIDDCLTTHVQYRSWDLWGGWPTNMGAFVLLNEWVADAIGVEPGPLTFGCKSLHIYEHHFDSLQARVGDLKLEKD